MQADATALFTDLFPGTVSNAWPVLGSHTALVKWTKEDMKEFKSTGVGTFSLSTDSLSIQHTNWVSLFPHHSVSPCLNGFFTSFVSRYILPPWILLCSLHSQCPPQHLLTSQTYPRMMTMLGNWKTLCLRGAVSIQPPLQIS